MKTRRVGARAWRGRAVAVGSIVFAACGGGDAHVAAPAVVVAAAPPPPRSPRLRLSSELGEIDEAATKQTFDAARAALLRCYASGLERVDVLAGDVKFYLRVKPDGTLRWAVLEQSTLGDRDTETCMLGVLSSAHWPHPEGGEAEVHSGLGFDAPSGVRPPSDWSSDKVKIALGKKAADVTSCKKHGPAAFQITAYVEADHASGRVLAVGASAPAAPAAEDVDCLLGVVRTLKLPSPGSYPAKVSFPL